MKRISFVLTLISVILLTAAGCQKKPSADEIFAEAKKFQEDGKYTEAAAAYERLVQTHPKSELAPQSLFMVGFICANELKDLPRAETAYKTFLEKFSASADSGMVASAEWELRNLGKDINEIEELSVIMHSDSAAADTANPTAN